jgi:hypothetical protein
MERKERVGWKEGSNQKSRGHLIFFLMTCMHESNETEIRWDLNLLDPTNAASPSVASSFRFNGAPFRLVSGVTLMRQKGEVSVASTRSTRRMRCCDMVQGSRDCSRALFPDTGPGPGPGPEPRV